MHVCHVRPCVIVMRDGVGGRAQTCPQKRRSERERCCSRCVCRGGGGPQKCVRWEGVQCSVGVNCMHVCPARGVLRNGGESVQFCLIELGRGGVWWVCSQSARRSTTEVVKWVCWVFSGCVDVCASHTHVLF